MSARVRTETVDGILHVALNAEPLNEIGLPMLEELEEVADFVRRGAHGARAMVIRSDNPRGFSAGADLRELYAGLRAVDDGGGWRDTARGLVDSPSTALRSGLATLRGTLRRRDASPTGALKVWGVRMFIDRIHRVMDAFDAAPIPTVAAVHGVCFGGGFELALTCDVIVADKTARFSFPELRLGLIPGFGGIPRLERDLGNAVVRDILLSGRSISAKRAHQVGLASQLVGEGKAEEAARRLAEQMSRFDRDTATAAKRFLKPLPAARLAEERDRFCDLLTSPVVMEALRAFVESDDAMPYLPGRTRRPRGPA